MSSDPVIVAGAGIGRLAAALALLQRGVDVAVYERAAELAEIGAGVRDEKIDRSRRFQAVP